MIPSKRYELFIAHGWHRFQKYDQLVSMLENFEGFDWEICSVPERNPLIDPESEDGKLRLMEDVKRQIEPATCILIIDDVFDTYREWFLAEIEMVLEMNRMLDFDKLIIGITSGNVGEVSREIQRTADVLVEWKAEEIVKAIKLYSI